MHPFERPREYMRALNAVKLERLFAKPFLGQLGGGHKDGIYCLSKHGKCLTALVSGSADGSVALWDLGAIEGANVTAGGVLNINKPRLALEQAHAAFVRGVSFLHNQSEANAFLSCADDGLVKLWDSRGDVQKDASTTAFQYVVSQKKKTRHHEAHLVRQYASKGPLTAIDHHWRANQFATSGETVQLWHHERPGAIQTFEWGHDTFTSVRFNPAETNVLAAAATDRSLVLYDLRMKSALTRVVLAMRSNSIAWNPMEPFNFAVANEDSNVYCFDMRRMDVALNVLRDHVAAVMDVDYSPTGQELVSGAYDKSIRIFCTSSGHSRDVYHTGRMQKVFSVRFSMDSRYIFSGSDDGNLRLWRANASTRQGVTSPSFRQQSSRRYNDALVEKFGQLPDLQRISRSRHVPKAIKVAQRERRIIETSKKRRLDNKRTHSRPGAVPYPSKRKTNILETRN